MQIKVCKSNSKVAEVFELAGIKIKSWLFAAIEIDGEEALIHVHKNFSSDDLEDMIEILSFILEKIKEGEETSHLN